MVIHQKTLGILVGGGPAPGINSVIGAATIRSILYGTEVLGILDGFKWIMQGDISHTIDLNISNVSRIHFRGGSFIGVSRDNPTKNEKYLENAVTSLLRLNIDRLITIGGDDTAYSAMRLEQMADGRIQVVHVPKTIDNDLDLPMGICTFGFQTARHFGVEIIKNLMVDAQTTSRWFFVITMGRKAGHLALGTGKAAGATLTLIPEEFGNNNPLSFQKLTDILVGAIIKRLSYGRPDGIAVIAEGLVEQMPPEEIQALANVERDEHNNIRIAEINFGEMLKASVQKRLSEFGIKTTIVAKNIGYELRCSDPIPFDMEYTRDLGFLASKFIHEGGNGAVISIQENRFVPMYFKELIDNNTGRTRVRMIDISSENYQIGRQYMIRLSKADFEDPHELAKYAATVSISLEDFQNQFHYVVEHEPDIQSSGKNSHFNTVDGMDSGEPLDTEKTMKNQDN